MITGLQQIFSESRVTKWKNGERVLSTTGKRNIQKEISFIIVLTAVKFIGSMGFQAIELVFVCEKSRDYEYIPVEKQYR